MSQFFNKIKTIIKIILISLVLLSSIIILNNTLTINLISEETLFYCFSAFVTTERNLNFKIQISLTKVIIVQTQKRFMLSGRALHTARTAYHCLALLTNNDILNNSKKDNHEPLIKGLVELSLNNSKGTPQHKEAIITHITNYRFNVDFLYKFFSKTNGYENIVWNPNDTHDFRVLKELPLLKALMSKFGDNIQQVICTNDSHIPSFSHKIQENPDWLATIKCNNSFGKSCDKVIGINSAYKQVHFDEKGGNGMFKHSSSGSLGLITYDSDNQNVQTMSAPITPDILLTSDLKNMKNLREVIPTMGLKKKLEVFINDLELFESKRLGAPNIFEKRVEIQRCLWDNILSDPDYKRSISFVFTDHPEYIPLDAKGQAFEKRFLSLLNDKLYHLDRTQDRRDIYRAMLIAYKETVDPKIVEKLQYLNGITFTLSPRFLEDVARYLRTGLLSP